MSSLIRNIYSSDLIWKLIKNNIIKELCVPCYHTVNNKSQDRPHCLSPPGLWLVLPTRAVLSELVFTKEKIKGV